MGAFAPPSAAAELGAGFYGFSCEPCDPDEARALVAELAARASPRAAPAPPASLYELTAFGFSCTPCDPLDLGPELDDAQPECDDRAHRAGPERAAIAIVSPRPTSVQSADGPPCARDCPPECVVGGSGLNAPFDARRALGMASAPPPFPPCGDPVAAFELAQSDTSRLVRI